MLKSKYIYDKDIDFSEENRLNNLKLYKDFIVKRISTIFPLQWLLTLLFVLFSINPIRELYKKIKRYDLGTQRRALN